MKITTLMAFSASLAATGYATQAAAQRAISQSDAREAAQQHPKLVEEFGGAEMGARGAYVSAVGQKIVSRSGVPGASNAFRITTLNSPVMNAFAIPGGYVYITRQLLGLMDDEAELASVLGHEVGHIAARHSQSRQRTGLLSQLGAVLIGAVTGSSQIGQIVGQLSQGIFLKYSRDQEYQADELGVRYMAAAGYDTDAAASLLASLGAATALDAKVAGRNDERAVPSWARTHPLSADRVRRATQRAQASGAAGRGVRNRDQFLAQIDGVLVDDDPRQGVIEGREFRHPGLRLRFAVPQGYGIQNGTSAVSISGANGQAQFSGGAFSGDLGSYVSQVFQGLAGQQAGQLRIPQLQTTTINGIPAAYTTTRANTQQGQVDVTVFAYRFTANTAYHFAMITPAGRGLGPFGPMVSSFGRLSDAQAAGIRPRVLDVVAVRAGDTVQSLANRMAYSDYKLDRFLTLNSLEANSQLRPGDKVKLVVYS